MEITSSYARQSVQKSSLPVSSAVQPHILSTAEFHAAVDELAPPGRRLRLRRDPVVGDAGTGFMRWSIESGLLEREAIDWLDQRYRGYLRGDVSEIDICGEMVQVYQGLRESEVRAAAAEFFRTRIENNIFPEMFALVPVNCKRAVCSYGPSLPPATGWWRRACAASRSPPSAFCPRGSPWGRRVTRTLLDVPTDEAKVASLARVGIAQPDAVFGNSIHDAAMLAIARRAFPIDPTPALLQRCAQQEGWPVYYPASVAP